MRFAVDLPIFPPVISVQLAKKIFRSCLVILLDSGDCLLSLEIMLRKALMPPDEISVILASPLASSTAKRSSICS